MREYDLVPVAGRGTSGGAAAPAAAAEAGLDDDNNDDEDDGWKDTPWGSDDDDASSADDEDVDDAFGRVDLVISDPGESFRAVLAHQRRRAGEQLVET